MKEKQREKLDVWLDNLCLENKNQFVRKVRNILSNIQYDIIVFNSSKGFEIIERVCRI